MDKYLIVGLGNVGSEYDMTRHNTGFMVLDAFAKASNIVFEDKRYGYVAEVSIKGRKVFLLKPTTYMNLSGESIREVVDFYKLTCEDIVVIYDDISLDVGRLRIREKGSAGGHNGIKSIIAHLGTDVFPRIKVGVGQPNVDLVNYVLGKFTDEEMEVLSESIDASTKAVSEIIKYDVNTAMNKFNGFKATKSI